MGTEEKGLLTVRVLLGVQRRESRKWALVGVWEVGMCMYVCHSSISKRGRIPVVVAGVRLAVNGELGC